MNDNVTNPSHYQFSGACHEVKDVIRDRVFGSIHYGHGLIAYDYSNAIKYLLRWYLKNGIEDLEKAKFCIEEMINHERTKH